MASSFILTLLVWTSSNAVTSQSSITVEQLFLECHTVASRLKSVDFVFSLEQQGVGLRSMRLREREGKLRGDAFFGPYVPDAEGEQVQAFDGKIHLAFHVSDKRLGKTTKPADAMLLIFADPLCVPYQWMMKFPMSWSRAKSKALWLDCATRAKLQEPTILRGVRCQSLRLDFPSGGWQIVEIADGVRFPVRWTEYDSNGSAVTENVVREWKEFTTPDGPAVLPIVVDEILRHSGDGKLHELTIHHRVDLATVRINPELSDDIFTISESRASEIFDKDAKEVIVPEKGVIHKVNDDGTLKLNAERIPAKTSRGTWAVIGGLILAVVAVVAIRVGSRHREQ